MVLCSKVVRFLAFFLCIYSLHKCVLHKTSPQNSYIWYWKISQQSSIVNCGHGCAAMQDSHRWAYKADTWFLLMAYKSPWMTHGEGSPWTMQREVPWMWMWTCGVDTWFPWIMYESPWMISGEERKENSQVRRS